MKKHTMTGLRGGGAAYNPLPDRLYKGFTLSEVLITLGIIGIIAAMTLPGVITDFRKKTTAKKLQQAYNFLQQTVLMAQNDYGDMRNWECFIIESAYTEEMFAKQYIIPYLKGEQLHTYSALTSAGYKDYPKDLSGQTTLTAWKYFIKVNQGYLYMIDHYDVGDGSRRVFNVSIDINGERPPNIVGRDIFSVTYGYNVSPEKHYQLQMYNYNNRNRDELLKDDCNKDGYGGYCGAVIEMDDWEIKDDYPW